MYDFSLIDKIKSKESKNQSSNTTLDLENLNLVIKDALGIYNHEVINVSKINQEIDRLNRKNDKMKNKLLDINKSISDVSTYISSNYDESISSYEDIMSNVRNMNESLTMCISNIELYTLQENLKYRDVYNTSLDKINALNEVFTIAKFNKHCCPICLKNESTHFTLPCGHVYCEECSKKITVTCFICRGNVYKVSPLFFS